MTKGNALRISDLPLRWRPKSVEGTLTNVDNERFYCISNYDEIPPFLISLVSDSDHWLFTSSNGALTAGRKNSDQLSSHITPMIVFTIAMR